MKKNLDKIFIKEMYEYVETYKLLKRKDLNKEAHSYVLCFYASFLGFLHQIYSTDRTITTFTLKELSIDLGIIYDLNNYIYSEDLKNDKDSNSVYYCFNKSKQYEYENINYIFKNFFKLHKEIALSSKISDNEDKNIENTKKLIISIKPSLEQRLR